MYLVSLNLALKDKHDFWRCIFVISVNRGLIYTFLSYIKVGGLEEMSLHCS
jgi:hypothetical protein